MVRSQTMHQFVLAALCLTTAVAFFAQPVSAQTGGGVDARWTTLNDAAVIQLTDGDGVMLGESVGQIAPGQMDGAGVVLIGGFWAATSDCNDNDVDDDFDIALMDSEDCDTNGIPDECEADADTDFLTDVCDNCSSTANAGQEDVDGDGVGDACDNCIEDANTDQADAEGDGVGDTCDNCVSDVNAGQQDADTDTVGDPCDNCVNISNMDQTDSDADTVGDACDACPGYNDLTDCNNNAIPDGCDVTAATSFDCNGNIVPDECEAHEWIGLDGGSFEVGGNWSPFGLPDIDAVLSYSGAGENRCIIGAVNDYTLCHLTVSGGGGGSQVLRINEAVRLIALTGTDVNPGGAIDLQGGELTGGPVLNLSNTITGYGRIAADVYNEGLIRALPSDDLILRITGDVFENRSTGTVLATVGSLVIVQSENVSQSGTLNVRAQAAMTFAGPLVNEAGGLLNLAGGALAADGVTNSAGATATGFGTIDAHVTNDGVVITLADMQIAGDLDNEGTVYIQNGLLTVLGNLLGSGAIIGGFGGRDGDPAGLVVQGDFDVAVTNAGSMDLAGMTLFMNPPASGRRAVPAQTLEVLAPDRGTNGVSLPDADLYSIGELHVGPNPTTVVLADRHANARGRAVGEALYVERLVLHPGVTLDLAGRHVYCNEVTPEDPLAADSGVTVVDSVGGGSLVRLTD